MRKGKGTEQLRESSIRASSLYSFAGRGSEAASESFPGFERGMRRLLANPSPAGAARILGLSRPLFPHHPCPHFFAQGSWSRPGFPFQRPAGGTPSARVPCARCLCWLSPTPLAAPPRADSPCAILPLHTQTGTRPHSGQHLKPHFINTIKAHSAHLGF